MVLGTSPFGVENDRKSAVDKYSIKIESIITTFLRLFS